MAVITNKNTTQTPMSTVGRTGTQVLKFIPAPRIYVKTPDSLTAAPVEDYFTKSNGTTPTGWTDLGSVSTVFTLTYDQKVKQVTTGIDQYLRAAYLEARGATFKAVLDQTDDVVLEQISAATASVITSGSIVNYQIGSTDMNQLAILLVVQNKLDGKEWQFYNPNAYLTFNLTESGGVMGLAVDGFMPSFKPSGATTEGFLSATMFA